VANLARASLRDPRYRRFRVFAYGAYIAVVSVFSINVIVSVVRSVMVMNPGQRPPSEVTLTVRECLDGAEQLWSELDAQRQGLASHSPARSVDQEWSHFRVQWLDRFRDIESHCALNSRSRVALKGVYEKLDHIQDLYMTHAVQFAGEVGGAIDRYRAAVQAVKKELGEGRAM
jgi:hypothetical protein